MSDIKEELIQVRMVEDSQDGVKIECTIKKILFVKMFGSWDFQKELERQVIMKIINEMPIETINEVMGKVDLNHVAKLVTFEMSKIGDNANRR